MAEMWQGNREAPRCFLILTIAPHITGGHYIQGPGGDVEAPEVQFPAAHPHPTYLVM